MRREDHGARGNGLVLEEREQIADADQVRPRHRHPRADLEFVRPRRSAIDRGDRVGLTLDECPQQPLVGEAAAPVSTMSATKSSSESSTPARRWSAVPDSANHPPLIAELPPSRSRFSTRATLSPFAASRCVAARPASPPPTTIASTSRRVLIGGGQVRLNAPGSAVRRNRATSTVVPVRAASAAASTSASVRDASSAETSGSASPRATSMK